MPKTDQKIPCESCGVITRKGEMTKDVNTGNYVCPTC